MRSQLILGLLAATALSAACKKEVDRTGTAERVQVEEVTLGSEVGSDKRVVQEKSSFQPNDTIYLTVETKGSAPEATVTARWKYQDDQIVNESTQRIIPSGAVATEFHVEKPDGFPAGKYKVEVLLNGEKVEEKAFEIEVGT